MAQPVVTLTAAAMLSASNPTFTTAAQSTLSFCGELGRLDGNQREKYGGQPAYDAWVARSGALWPVFSSR